MKIWLKVCISKLKKMTKVNLKKPDKNFSTLSPYLSVWSLNLNCVAPSEKIQEDRSQS